MAFKHFLHEHPLDLLEWEPYGLCECSMCGLHVTSLAYYCDEYLCSPFYIHKSCAKLLQRINHPFHPQHPLTFLADPPYDSKSFQCAACGKNSSGSTYHCSQCGYDLDIGCAELMPVRTSQSINHHIGDGDPHPLILCHTERETDFQCSGCWETIEKDSIYVCLECKIFLHKSCAELPNEIRNHPFHPNHTLTLLRHPPDDSGYFHCYACGDFQQGLSYHCFECEFDLHIQCSSLMPIKTFNVVKDEDDHKYVRHCHPLFLCKSTRNFRFFCTCEEALEDNSIICCLECHHLLHKSCAELPVEIEHPFHRLHPLTLTLMTIQDDFYRTYCRACLQVVGNGYDCNDCNDCNDWSRILCTCCAFSTPQTLKSKLHRHPLAFFSLVAKDLCCTLCNLSSKTNFFRCLDCNFNVHFLCIPGLPRVVSDGNHLHLLTLTETPVKDYEDEDDNAEFLCDRCEKERRLYDLTYYCADCHYVAHIECVISEVIHLMEEECTLDQKLGDKSEVVSKALTTEAEGTKSGKVEANKHSILYSVTEIDEEIIALRADIEEQELELKTSRKELKALEKEFKKCGLSHTLE